MKWQCYKVELLKFQKFQGDPLGVQGDSLAVQGDPLAVQRVPLAVQGDPLQVEGHHLADQAAAVQAAADQVMEEVPLQA